VGCASVSKMIFLSTDIAVSFSLQWVLSSLGPLNSLISTSRSLEMFENCWSAKSLEVVGVENPYLCD
jgi:hypothetical protein